MILLACAVLLLGSFIYVFAPVRAQDLAHGEKKSRLSFLRERKDVLYENLRDLNFEYKAGKFPEPDYLAQRTALEAEAASVLAEIDDLEHAR